jgi:hypothetical protein
VLPTFTTANTPSAKQSAKLLQLSIVYLQYETAQEAEVKRSQEWSTAAAESIYNVLFSKKKEVINPLQRCSYYMSHTSILTHGFMSATEFIEYVENTYVYTID